MLTPERIRQLEYDALLRAKALSPESLRAEAVNAHAGHNDAPEGSDERTELGILARTFTREMVERGMTAG